MQVEAQGLRVRQAPCGPQGLAGAVQHRDGPRPDLGLQGVRIGCWPGKLYGPKSDVLSRVVQPHPGRERVAISPDRPIEHEAHAQLLESGRLLGPLQGLGVCS